MQVLKLKKHKIYKNKHIISFSRIFKSYFDSSSKTVPLESCAKA